MATGEPQILTPSATDTEEVLHEKSQEIAESNDSPKPSSDPQSESDGTRAYRGEIRTDPFQFGTRYLLETDDPFAYNAWDHVEVDDEYRAYAEEQLQKQRDSPVSDYDKTRFNTNPAKWWDLFYKNNTTNFFKNRKWLQHEFPVLAEITAEDYGPVTVLEVGAGAGNTAFPVLKQNTNPNFKIHAVDYSKKAVDLIRNHEEYDEKFIQADVWDIASDQLPPGLAEGSVDIVILIFIFSALSPDQWASAVSNVYKLLKPGGQVLFRDYGRGDLAQVRFRKGRYLDENFYIRGDGTRVYFFDIDELKSIWGDWKPSSQGEEVTGFDVEKVAADRRLIVNRQRRLKMHRCWLQAKFVRR